MRYSPLRTRTKFCCWLTVILGGYIYTKDINRVRRAVEKLDAGTIGINSGMVSDAAVPFGGIKDFGKEGSKYGLEDYIVVKALTFGGINRVVAVPDLLRSTE